MIVLYRVAMDVIPLVYICESILDAAYCIAVSINQK